MRLKSTPVAAEILNEICGATSTNGKSGDFSVKRQKNITGTTRSTQASKLKIVVDWTITGATTPAR